MIWPRRRPRSTEQQERLSEASVAFLRAVAEQLESNVDQLNTLTRELQQVTADRRARTEGTERAQ